MIQTNKQPQGVETHRFAPEGTLTSKFTLTLDKKENCYSRLHKKNSRHSWKLLWLSNPYGRERMQRKGWNLRPFKY